MSLPSPGQAVWHLGPVPIRAYALCLIAGIVVAVVMSERRWTARGGEPGFVGDLAVWAVPAGVIGARIYHVVTDPELYFAPGRNAWDVLVVWHGGLGIWGAVIGGAAGAWLFCRRHGVRLSDVADTVAPGLLVAQAMGRWGNYFNQELFGGPSTLPWALQIDPEHRPEGYEHFSTFHPTFLYESMWNLALAALLIVLGRHRAFTNGRLFALYVMGYTAGRLWIELLRIDAANTILGLRVNVWTCLALFTAALVFFVARRPVAEGDVAGRRLSGTFGH